MSLHCYMCVLILLYVFLYCYVCVLMLLYVYPHTAIYVSSCCHVCVFRLLYIKMSGSGYMCVLILLHMCPIYVSSYCYIYVSSYCYTCECAQAHWTLFVSSYCCICVLILLYMCLHTATYASALRHTGRESCMRTRIYCIATYVLYIRVLIYVSSYWAHAEHVLLYIRVLILLYVRSGTLDVSPV